MAREDMSRAVMFVALIAGGIYCLMNGHHHAGVFLMLLLLII